MSNLPTLSIWCTIAQSHTGAVYLQQWCNNIYIYIKKIWINQNISPNNNNNNSKNKIILNNKTILSQKRLVLAKLSRDLKKGISR